MAIEIERKFLLASDAWRAEVAASERLAQGYLGNAERASVRVRIGAGHAFLNIKSRELGAQRQEFEYEVPLADAEQLLQLCLPGRIEKIRHHVRHAGMLWEIDEFLGDNAGLVVAEIELDQPEQRFERPAWLGAEVTDDERYYNIALAQRPYALWGRAGREP